MAMMGSAQQDSAAVERYLLLADISGYTAFMASVERAHGVDFGLGIPAGYAVLGELLDALVDGVQPAFEVAKIEGDAVFAVAPAATLDGRGGDVLEQLQAIYRVFQARREQAKSARDHACTACPVVSTLDLKMVLHRGHAVRQRVGSRDELLGPAVNVAHRLLKNSVQAHVGRRPYLFMTDTAATKLQLEDSGVGHVEDYPDVGRISGRVVPLGDGQATEKEPRLPVESSDSESAKRGSR